VAGYQCPVCKEWVPFDKGQAGKKHACSGKPLPKLPSLCTPHDPHLVDNNIPKQLNMVADPQPGIIDEIPALGTLVANVKALLKRAGIVDKVAPAVDITKPGAIFVLKKGVANTPFAGWERADVMNGDLNHPELKANHAAWVKQNQTYLEAQTSPKLKTADPNYLYGRDGAIIGSSALPANGGSTNGQWNNETKRITMNAHVECGGMLVHEYLHTFDKWDPSDIGWGMDEGFVAFFARALTARHKYKYKGNWAYQGGYLAVKEVVDKIGLKKVCHFWFLRDAALLKLVGPKTKIIADKVLPNTDPSYTQKDIDVVCDAIESWKGWV